MAPHHNGIVENSILRFVGDKRLPWFDVHGQFRVDEGLGRT
jgi:hypothetical protein